MRLDTRKPLPFQLEKILNNGIDFQDNIRGGFVEYTTAGCEDVVVHNLGYTPSGFLVILRTGVVDIWATSSQVRMWNGEKMLLQSNAMNVTVRLFVM